MFPAQHQSHSKTCAVFVKTHQGQIRAFLRRLTRNAALADDLAQDTFLRAFEKMDQIQDTAKSKSWLFQIAYRVFLDHLRKAKRRGELAEENAPPDEDNPSAPDGLKMDIEQAMNALTPAQRAAVILCLSYGMSHAEAAQVLEQPLGTVKSHVARGKTQLRAFLSAYERA